jgi:hypothetical protein
LLLRSRNRSPRRGCGAWPEKGKQGGVLRNRKMDSMALQYARPIIALRSAFDHDHIFNELLLADRADQSVVELLPALVSLLHH